MTPQINSKIKKYDKYLKFIYILWIHSLVKELKVCNIA